MGNFLFSSGRFAEAVPYYRRTANMMPDNFMAINNLGAVHFMLSEFDQAAEAWQRAIALNPNAVTYSNAGSSLYFSGRYREAVDMFQKAVEQAPEDYELWGNLGDAYRFTSELQELAVPMYQNAIKLALAHLEVNPSDANTLALIGHYYAAAGNREQALLYNARATALAPRDMAVNYHSAVMLSTLGELEPAMAALARAVELGYSKDLIAADAGLAPLRKTGDYLRLVDASTDQMPNQAATEE
jgi:tetratricopeptide (TPR) repeat protein